MQLPPVSREAGTAQAGLGRAVSAFTAATRPGFAGGVPAAPLKSEFAFESAVWGACFRTHQVFQLTQVFRQSDNTFGTSPPWCCVCLVE